MRSIKLFLKNFLINLIKKRISGCVFFTVFFVTITLSAASITVTNPNSTSSWWIGGTYTIRWNHSGFSNPENLKVNIILRKRTGFVCEIAHQLPLTSGNYPWKIATADCPGLVPGNYYIRVRIVAGVMGDSPEFTIYQMTITPYITLFSPNGGEKWEFGIYHTIRWRYMGLSRNVHVHLYLLKNERQKGVIKYNVPISDGKYVWEVGKDLRGKGMGTGKDFKVRISSPRFEDDSNQTFEITPPKVRAKPLRTLILPAVRSESGAIFRRIPIANPGLQGSFGFSHEHFVGFFQSSSSDLYFSYRAILSYNPNTLRALLPRGARISKVRLNITKIYQSPPSGDPFNKLGNFQIIQVKYSTIRNKEKEIYYQGGTVLYNKGGHTREFDIIGIDVTRHFLNTYNSGESRFQVRMQFKKEYIRSNQRHGFYFMGGRKGCFLKVFFSIDNQ